MWGYSQGGSFCLVLKHKNDYFFRYLLLYQAHFSSSFFLFSSFQTLKGNIFVQPRSKFDHFKLFSSMLHIMWRQKLVYVELQKHEPSSDLFPF